MDAVQQGICRKYLNNDKSYHSFAFFENHRLTENGGDMKLIVGTDITCSFNACKEGYRKYD